MSLNNCTGKRMGGGGGRFSNLDLITKAFKNIVYYFLSCLVTKEFLFDLNYLLVI